MCQYVVIKYNSKTGIEYLTCHGSCLIPRFSIFGDDESKSVSKMQSGLRLNCNVLISLIIVYMCILHQYVSDACGY